ncbi:hypothetical protein SRHO_G00133990 [Serrasalmus rhombeus]
MCSRRSKVRPGRGQGADGQATNLSVKQHCDLCALSSRMSFLKDWTGVRSGGKGAAPGLALLLSHLGSGVNGGERRQASLSLDLSGWIW